MGGDNTLCIAPVNTQSIATVCIMGGMTTSRSERLRDARQKAGFASAAEAADRFGWQVGTYRHHENGTRGFGADVAKRYGRAFKVKAGWLLGLENVQESLTSDSAQSDLLGVTGSVAAGVWREAEYWSDDRRFVINLPSPMPGVQRFGVVVEGRSMDLAYEPGTVLDCVSIYSRDVKPQTGDHVIVERTRPDGLRELTVKEYREENGRFYLVPRSTVREFKPVEYAGPDDMTQATADPTSDASVRVIAFVVASYPPRVLGLMERMGLVIRPGAQANAA